MLFDGVLALEKVFANFADCLDEVGAGFASGQELEGVGNTPEVGRRISVTVLSEVEDRVMEVSRDVFRDGVGAFAARVHAHVPFFGITLHASQ